MCRLRKIAMRDYRKNVTTGQTDAEKKLSICTSMLRRGHKNWV